MWRDTVTKTRERFNPRAPCGARRRITRGAQPVGVGISTHAPLAGRDRREKGLHTHNFDFNPRAPCGARLYDPSPLFWFYYISTHAPLAGRDIRSTTAPKTMRISTHAPLAGRDLTATVIFSELRFQPTRPLRGATQQSRDPNTQQEFQPTRPLRGATSLIEYTPKIINISTHAPLAGRDSLRIGSPCQLFRFQPTRPLRGATIRDKRGNNPKSYFNPRAPCGARQQKCTNHYAHFCDNRQISDAFAQNAACQGILLLFDAGKPCGFWVRTAQVISAHLCFAL